MAGLVSGAVYLEALLFPAFSGELFGVSTITIAVTVAVLLLVRWRGVRLIRQDDSDPSAAAPPGLRFSIRGVMLITAVVALLSALARYLQDSPHHQPLVVERLGRVLRHGGAGVPVGGAGGCPAALAGAGGACSLAGPRDLLRRCRRCPHRGVFLHHPGHAPVRGAVFRSLLVVRSSGYRLVRQVARGRRTAGRGAGRRARVPRRTLTFDENWRTDMAPTERLVPDSSPTASIPVNRRDLVPRSATCETRAWGGSIPTPQAPANRTAITTMMGNCVERESSQAGVARGKPQIGTWLSLGSIAAARFMARAGFPWLTVDMEHTHTDIQTAAFMFGAIADAGCVPLARIPTGKHEYIKMVLDCGAMGIVAPMVMDAAEARSIVAATKYPPRGNRSVGGGMHALNFGATAEEYYSKADDEILVIIQTEHIKAVEIADEIYSVPGVDAVFVGPNDLAYSMRSADGTPPGKETFEATLTRIREAAQRNRLPAACTFSPPPTPCGAPAKAGSSSPSAASSR